MNDEDFDDIDYEHLDDLPLPEHIEWNHVQPDEETEDETPAIDWLDDEI
ncbi:MAG: hypothetical protein ACU84H_12475 [Gammaproteobacteria bacterium]